MSLPSSVTVPLVGCKCPVIRLNRVDLPAPLGPITAAICCVSTRRLTSVTARKPAKDFEIPVSSSNGAAPGAAHHIMAQAVERAEDATGEPEQQNDQNGTEKKRPVFGDCGDLLVEDRHHRGAERRPPEMVHAAEDG